MCIYIQKERYCNKITLFSTKHKQFVSVSGKSERIMKEQDCKEMQYVSMESQFLSY